ncbi:MAG: TolC family protein [Myxococcota bacterium]|nr:TolC family protein [Myxococcota bacterium]
MDHRRGTAKKPIYGRSFGVLVALLLGAPGARASQVVTVDQAVSQAMARPALVATLEAERQEAEAEAVAVGVWPNPEVTYEREQLSETEQVIHVSQEVDLAGRRGLRADAARRRADATRLDGEARKRRIGVETRLAFWAVAHQQARYEVAGAWLQRLETAEAQTIAREKAGEGSRYDVLRMAREVRRARADLELTEVNRESAWLRLQTLTGALAAPEGWPRVAGEMVPSDLAAMTSDIAVRQDIQAWRARAEAAGLEASAGRRGWIPRLGLTAGMKRVDGAVTKDSGVTAGVTLSLPLFDRGQGETARASSAQGRAEATARWISEDAARLVGPAQERTRRLTALARSLRQETEADTRALESTAQAAWLAGELGLTELLDVQRDARDDRLALLDLERAARAAREQLRRLTLEDSP